MSKKQNDYQNVNETLACRTKNLNLLCLNDLGGGGGGGETLISDIYVSLFDLY